MSIPVLDLDGLAYAYPDGTPALNGVSFGIGPGERVALLGANGAGKTTLLLHLIGLLEPRAGQVRVSGIPVTPETAREVRRRVGFVFQDADDQLFMTTVRQDVAFGPTNFGVTGAALDGRVARALAAVGMESTGDRAPHHLSVGERRRVALATVLAMEPEVLVLDEPSASLDSEGRRDLALTLRASGQTVLMVTHDLPFALEVCERSVVMSQGRVVADGPTGEILSDHEALAAHRLFLPHGFDPALARRVEGAAG